jgi:NADP-dependent aldehyde dehydrogenase
MRDDVGTTLTGDCRIGGKAVTGGGDAYTGVDARTAASLPPTCRDATVAQIDLACSAAAGAAAAYAATGAPARARFLRAVADGIVGLGDALLARCEQETALPRPRLESERGRTVNQLRMFAALLEEGSWVDASIERALPDRQPVPRPDLRRMSLPLGPVAVFGSSNFPFAYSVAGGDTASALAAGCPVVVKAHPAHPGTGELVARAIDAAVASCGMPAGTFAFVHGRGHGVGKALVLHPAIAAVGFTGSPQGGRALCDAAASRSQPIPVFAEMGSSNPVFVLPEALAQRAARVAETLAASATGAVGQMCTCPGLVVVVEGAGADALARELQQRIAAVPAGVLVHSSIGEHFARAVAEIEALGAVAVARGGHGRAAAATETAAVLYTATAEQVLQHERLRAEVFGPALLLVRCRDHAQMLAVAAALPGQLTGTLHGTDDDLIANQDLFLLLQQRVGRVVVNGVPTGVEVGSAMQHGGPWPASSAAATTSVGTAAIRRWVRPVCFQDVPQALLPVELRDGNPAGIWRLVDGLPGRT